MIQFFTKNSLYAYHFSKNKNCFINKIIKRNFTLLVKSNSYLNTTNLVVLNIPRIIEFKRFMKRMAGKLYLNDIQKQRLSQHTHDIIKTTFHEPIRNKIDILDRLIEYLKNPALGENITKQTFAKGLFPRNSYLKESIMSAIKNAGLDSSKISIENLKEKTDIRWITEYITAYRFAESSHLIQEIHMNSENPNKTSIITAMLSKSQTGQIHADTIIKLKINGEVTDLFRDIKSGNNANEPFSGVLAEIPITQDNEYYTVMNDIIDITKIQDTRMYFINNIAQTQESFKDFSKKFNTIKNLPIHEIEKNKIIQEYIFQHIHKHEILLKTSFYYHYKVKDFTVLNEVFHRRLEPYINNTIFDSKKNYVQFMKIAIQTYCETIKNINEDLKSFGWEQDLKK